MRNHFPSNIHQTSFLLLLKWLPTHDLSDWETQKANEMRKLSVRETLSPQISPPLPLIKSVFIYFIYDATDRRVKHVTSTYQQKLSLDSSVATNNSNLIRKEEKTLQ